MISTIIEQILSTVIGGIVKLIFNYVISPIMKILSQIVISIVSWYFYQISVFMLTIVDFLFDMFQMLAGVKPGLVFIGLTDLISGNTYGTTDDPANGIISGEDKDILIQLLTSKEVFTVFTTMVVIGIFLLFIFTIAKIVKTEFTTQGSQNAKGPILRKFGRALFNMVFTPVICIIGIIFSNMLLQLVTTAFLGDAEDLTISGVIFTSGCYDAGYNTGEMMVGLTDPVTTAVGGTINVVLGMLKPVIGDDTINFEGIPGEFTPNFLIKYSITESEFRYYYSKTADYKSDNRAAIDKMVKDKKDLLMDAYTYVTKHNDFIPLYGETVYNNSVIRNSVPSSGNKNHTMVTLSGVQYGMDAGNLNDWEYYVDFVDNVQKQLNLKEKAMLKGEKDKEGTPISYKYTYTLAEKNFLQINVGGVIGYINPYRVYYNAAQVSMDFNATRINYAFVIFASIILMKVMIFSSIGMVMRLYKCVILFLVLPGPISLSPLDDGAAFKKWQKKFMGSVMAAYSVIIAVNVYLSLARIFLGVDLQYYPSNYRDAYMSLSGPGGAIAEIMSLLASSELGGVIIQCIFVIVGGLMVERFCGDFASLFGVDNPMSEGKGTFNKLMEPVKKAGKLVADVAILVASIYTGGTAAMAAKGAKAAGTAAKSAQAASSAAKQAASKGKQVASKVQENSQNMNNAAKAGKKSEVTPDKKQPDSTTTDTSTEQKPEVKEEKKPDTVEETTDDTAKDNNSTDSTTESTDTSGGNDDTTSEDTTEDTTEETSADDSDDEVTQGGGSTDSTPPLSPTPSDETPTQTGDDEDGDGDDEKEGSETEYMGIDSEDTPIIDDSEASDDEKPDDTGEKQSIGAKIKGASKAVGAKAKQKAIGTGKGLKDFGQRILPKMFDREVETLGRMAANTIKQNVPGFNLFDSTKKGRDNVLKDINSKGDSYKTAAENADKVRQERINKKLAEAHQFANRHDAKQSAELMVQSCSEAVKVYAENMKQEYMRLQSNLKNLEEDAKKADRAGDKELANNLRETRDNLLRQAKIEHEQDYDFAKDGELIGLKQNRQAEYMKAKIVDKIDALLNSGATREQIEAGLKSIVDDQTGSDGNPEVVRIINEAMSSLKDQIK